MNNIILQGHIIVADNDLIKVKAELEHHIKLTKAEVGCLHFSVRQDSDNPNRFNVSEKFVSQNAFEQHQLRVKQSTWGKVTVNVQRFYNIEQVADSEAIN